MIIKKVDVGELMNLLSELYEKGVNFVDVLEAPDGGALLRFYEEYLEDSAKEEFNQIVKQMSESESLSDKIKLSDEDIDKLV